MLMDDTTIQNSPKLYSAILDKSSEIGFTMPSDIYIGSLLKTLITSKANILELGTGVGLSLAWMIDGMGPDSKLTTVDNNPELTNIATDFFGNDSRVEIVCMDGANWISNYQGPKFDLIFADAWPGKYSHIEATLDLIEIGGFYVIDDMTPQANWPEGHELNVKQLIEYLEKRVDFSLTKMNWSTGVILMTRGGGGIE